MFRVIPRLQDNLTTATNERATEQRKIEPLNNRITQQRRTIADLRSKGASSDEIRSQERRLNAMISTRDNIQKKVNELTERIGRINHQIRGRQTRAQEINRSIQQKKQQIPRLEAQLNQLRSQSRNISQSITSLQRRVSDIEGQIRSTQRQLMPLRREMEGVLRQLSKAENVLSQRNRELREIEQQLTNTANQIQGAENRLSQLDGQARSEVAAMERRISEIRNLNDQIERLNQQKEQQLHAQGPQEQRLNNAQNIYQQEVTLGQELYSEYDRRHNLYQHNLNAARQLGELQTRDANSLGEQYGEKLAITLSQKIGSQMGENLGKAEALLWGYVRGEVQGYHAGYQDGIQSAPVAEQARVKAEQQALKSATLKAQNKFKPQFFEQELQKLLQESLTEENKKQSRDSTKSMSIKPSNQQGNQAFLSQSNTAIPHSAIVQPLLMQSERYLNNDNPNKIDPITEDELNLSLDLVTSLDDKIEKLIEQYQRIKQDNERLSQASEAYQVPSDTPPFTIDCERVYKKVVDFVVACKAAAQHEFRRRYRASAKQRFEHDYPDLYLTMRQKLRFHSQSQYYEQYFLTAFEVAHQVGEQAGEEDHFNETYHETFDLRYPQVLQEQKGIAKMEAAQQVAQIIQEKAIVTIEKVALTANLTAGEQSYLTISLKNISHVDDQGLKKIEIKASEFLIFKQNIVYLDDVAARSIKTFKIPYHVATNAQTSQKLQVQLTASLPGDYYQVERIESAQATEYAAFNARSAIELNYNETPRTRHIGIIRARHHVRVTLAPIFENLEEGVQLQLEVMGDAAESVRLSRSSRNIPGTLKVGEPVTTRLSYSFHRSLRSTPVKFEIKVLHRQRVVQTKEFTVTPR